MRKYLIIAAALTMASSLATAETFQESFEMNRAMYGKGHSFTWDGKQYTTDHPEEVEAAVEPTKANAEALLATAIAKNKEVAELGFEWKLTRGILKDAQAAIDAGDYQKALALSAQAKYHARMGIAQYHDAENSWQKAVPQ